MRRLVVDASVAAKWVFPESDSDKARRLLADRLAGTVQLLAPDHFVAEVTNLAWKKSVLRGEVSQEEAERALSALLAYLPEIRPSTDLALPAWRLAAAHRRSVYDCLYVALAVAEGCQLVTADAALARALEASLGCVVALSSL